MIGPTCPKCGHVGHPTRAVGIFRNGGPIGYRAAYDIAPLCATREEAEADMCAWRVERRHRTPVAEVAATELVALPVRGDGPSAAEPEPAAPFPAVEMETAARAKAWRDFLAQIRLSLMVWEIDGEVREGCEHVLTWLRRCVDELAALGSVREAS